MISQDKKGELFKKSSPPRLHDIIPLEKTLEKTKVIKTTLRGFNYDKEKKQALQQRIKATIGIRLSIGERKSASDMQEVRNIG